MTARIPPSWRQLLALLALVAQLATGASVPPILDIAAGGVPICHGGEQPVDAPAPHHEGDCVLCPICAAIGSPSAFLAAAEPALPLPRTPVVTLAAPPPPATAPPSTHRLAARPRAPPSQA
ncbi:MAG: hypothetical protein P4L71_12700 [Acetobacteraceae bacterium]|nr:hypothetical protein [Acetobacteraceae bacterium]